MPPRLQNCEPPTYIYDHGEILMFAHALTTYGAQTKLIDLKMSICELIWPFCLVHTGHLALMPSSQSANNQGKNSAHYISFVKTTAAIEQESRQSDIRRNKAQPSM